MAVNYKWETFQIQAVFQKQSPSLIHTWKRTKPNQVLNSNQDRISLFFSFVFGITRVLEEKLNTNEEEYQRLIDQSWMEKKGDDNSIVSMANSTFSDDNPAASAFALPSIFDMSCEGDYKWGFMDLLSVHNQDFGCGVSLFDSLKYPPINLQPLQEQQHQYQQPHPLLLSASTVPESSEALNNPATPNSSSISSSSNEGTNNEDQTTTTTTTTNNKNNNNKGGDEEEQDQDKTKKQ